jgi:hypothetical protein
MASLQHPKHRTKRCTEWRPRDAACQFGSHRGAAIGELILSRLGRGRDRGRVRLSAWSGVRHTFDAGDLYGVFVLFVAFCSQKCQHEYLLAFSCKSPTNYAMGKRYYVQRSEL